MPTLAPSSRIQLLSRPIAHPGKCVQCGAVDKEVIDTGVTIRWYGAVYFCLECITEMALALDMVPASVLKDSERAAVEVTKDYLKSNGLVAVNADKYNSALGNISSGFADLSFSLDILYVDPNTRLSDQDEPPTPALSELTVQPIQLILDSLTNITEPTRKSDDTVVSEGPNVVSDGGNEFRLSFE